MATRHLQKRFWLILCVPPCSYFPTMAEEEVAVVVADNGSGTCNTEFAGDDICRSEWCKQACNTRLCADCLREIVFSPGGTAAAALRSGAAARRGHRCCRSLVGELARHTPQTRCLTCVWRCIVMKAVFSLRFTIVLCCILLDMSLCTAQ